MSQSLRETKRLNLAHKWWVLAEFALCHTNPFFFFRIETSMKSWRKSGREETKKLDDSSAQCVSKREKTLMETLLFHSHLHLPPAFWFIFHGNGRLIWVLLFPEVGGAAAYLVLEIFFQQQNFFWSCHFFPRKRWTTLFRFLKGKRIGYVQHSYFRFLFKWGKFARNQPILTSFQQRISKPWGRQ